MLNAEGLVLTALDKIIKDIIVSVECTPENYLKIIEENKLLKKLLDRKNQKDYKEDPIVMIKHNKHAKNKDGVYNIDENIYKTLYGSRTDVYNGKSYQTSGLLTKSDLIINKHGKIVSRSKSIGGKLISNLDKVIQEQIKQAELRRVGPS